MKTTAGLLAAPGIGGGRAAGPQPEEAGPQPETVRPRLRNGRKIFRTVLPAALVAAIFLFALPHFASYRSVWSSLHAMTWPQALLVAAAAAASMASAWFMICAVLPSVRLREAAVVNLGSNAVANTLPGGGALAMGVSWAMLSGWGVSTAEYVLYSLVSGIWNVFARLGLPVLALLVLVPAARPAAGLIAAAVVGLALLAAAAAALGLLLRSESFADRAGRALQRVLVVACRLVRRPATFDVSGSLLGFRSRAGALIAARGGRITPAADGAAHYPRRSRHHRTRTDRHPGGRRRPPGQRAGDSRRAVVPGRHVPAPDPPRRYCLPDMAARARAVWRYAPALIHPALEGCCQYQDNQALGT